ncbi:hypothetical protein RA210_U20121 [Rubrivivax sp. A210]|nr:hypothetical protein RA210_U20121 [Rubrivivax sp. A210]
MPRPPDFPAIQPSMSEGGHTIGRFQAPNLQGFA